MSEGLSRRRGARPQADGNDNDTERPSRPSAGPSSSSYASPTSPGRSTGNGSGAVNGSSSAGQGKEGSGTTGKQHKVAYDPRDLEERSDEDQYPKLTLLEEVLLLGLKE